MNIFVLDEDPAVAASFHCDQHLNKMILESAQMLSTAAHLLEMNVPEIYKPGYVNHPCTIWTRQSQANMLWLIQLAIELNGLRPVDHQSVFVVHRIKKHVYHGVDERTPWAEAMPEHIQNESGLTTVEKYRAYYQHKHNEWKLAGKAMTFKNRGVPPWITL